MTGYLSELIYGDYANSSEDRLSQIFSASFNHSPVFQKAILRLMELSCRPHYSSETQDVYDVGGEKCKIDISLKFKNKPHVIIENKIDAPLFARQLRTYNRIQALQNVKKFSIVKAYKPEEDYPSNWQIIHWHDIHELLKRECSDDFICRNFIEILEEHNMMVPKRITRAELRGLAEGLHYIRESRQPSFALSGNVFETIIKYKAMLNEIWSMAKRDDIIRRRVGKNFRCAPGVSSWTDGDIPRGGRWFLCLWWNVRLLSKRKGIRFIDTGIYLRKRKGLFDITAGVRDNSGTWIEHVNYRKKDLVFADYAKQVISFWRRKLR